MNIERILEILMGLAVLKYFPAGNDSALLVLARLAGSMCSTEAQVQWLVDRMTSGLYTEWPGPAEMRAVFCSKFPPKDGQTAYSTVYHDGIPSENTGIRLLDGVAMKAIPPGHIASADAFAEGTVRLLVGAKQVTGMGGPTTPAEIAAAPEWLKRIDGYE